MPRNTRLNHAVLYVSDLDRSAAFYKAAFGMEEIAREGGVIAFVRAAGSSNHHDLALMSVGAQAPPPPPGSVGLCGSVVDEPCCTASPMLFASR